MREILGSWLSGPASVKLEKGLGNAPSTVDPVDEAYYPGEDVGLPESGKGSVSGAGRRLGALCIDWYVCYALAWLMSADHKASMALVLWFVLCAFCVGLVNCTLGQFILRIGVLRLDAPGERVGFAKAAARQALLVPLLIPAFFMDKDKRGLQDRATATAVVRV